MRGTQRKQAYLTTIIKIKIAQTNKIIEQDQNTNRGHPPNSIQVCPVTQVKLWRIKVQERRKVGNGEKLEGWKLKINDETRYINWVGRKRLKTF